MSQEKPIWVEDDCTRNTEGHEGLAEAWQRLFGKSYDRKQIIKTVDHGDCMEYQFPGGISVWNIFGAYYEIRKTGHP